MTEELKPKGSRNLQYVLANCHADVPLFNHVSHDVITTLEVKGSVSITNRALPILASCNKSNISGQI